MIPHKSVLHQRSQLRSKQDIAIKPGINEMVIHIIEGNRCVLH